MLVSHKFEDVRLITVADALCNVKRLVCGYEACFAGALCNVALCNVENCIG